MMNISFKPRVKVDKWLYWIVSRKGTHHRMSLYLDEGLRLAKQNGHTDLLEWLDKQ